MHGADRDVAVAAGGADGAEDEMVEQRHRHHARSLHEPLSEQEVLLARRRIARGVVVRDHDRVRAPPERLLEDLPRMDHGPVERPDRNDDRVRERMELGVEHEQGEPLLAVVRAQDAPEDAVNEMVNHASAQLAARGYNISAGVCSQLKSELDLSALTCSAENAMFQAKRAFYAQTGRDRRRR